MKFRPKYDYGFNCRECGLEGEDDILVWYSLDAYDDNLDAFCPRCHSDNIQFHKAAEDYREE